MSWRRTLKFSFQAALFWITFQYLIGPSTLPLDDPIANIRAFTRQVEFNYISWTIDAFEIKFKQVALNAIDYLDDEAQHQLVLDYIALVDEIQATENHLNQLYADPTIENKEASTAPVREKLETLYQQRTLLAPMAESVLQLRVAAVTSKMGFNPGGQPVPPVLFHSTPLPWALIVSPRDAIEQSANISLETQLTVEDHIILEDAIADGLDVSTLVVPVGGIGTYPTMVAQSSHLVWISEVISHEWAHNYLTLRPLGMLYGHTPEMRIINETTASIFGNEVGDAIITAYFPEFTPPPPAPVEEEDQQDEPQPTTEPPAFDFRAEMRETRVTVDEMLAGGKIEEAESYMEERRQFFWDHGYRHIRKLNQAYFAFYGAYGDVPGGAAGEDPVGAAVRELRARSDTLMDFIDTISWVTSWEDLQELMQESPTS
jgi:hypothetical protein